MNAVSFNKHLCVFAANEKKKKNNENNLELVSLSVVFIYMIAAY